MKSENLELARSRHSSSSLNKSSFTSRRVKTIWLPDWSINSDETRVTEEGLQTLDFGLLNLRLKTSDKTSLNYSLEVSFPTKPA